MANVITPQELRAWNREATGRFALATGIIVAIASVFAALAIFPAYIEVRTERMNREAALQAVQDETEQAAKSAAGGKVDRNTLSAVRKRLQAFEYFSKEQQIAEAIAFVVERRPKGMEIRSFNYVHKDGAGTLDIAGSIADRAALKPYAEQFKDKEPFSRATIPITSLARLEGGTFSLAISGSF